MKSIFPRFFVILFVILLSSLGAPQVSAEEAWRTKDTSECFKIADSEEKALCLAGSASAVLHAGEVTVAEQLGGCIDGLSRPEAGECAKEAAMGGAALSMNQGSLIAKSDQIIAVLYQNAPASTMEGMADLGRTFGLLPHQVYAQGPGIGFAGLAPLLPIWKVFRNVAYFLVAIIMVVIGFMVMFRKKIDPKTVVTVQNAIPGIIVTLLLITFSYAIVGIMIDLMYFSISLILAMLVPVGNSITKDVFDSNTYAKYLNAHWYNAMAMIFGAGLKTTDDIIGFITPGGSLASGAAAGGLAAGATAIIPFLGGAAAVLPAALWVGGIVAVLPILIVLLACIFAVFRILFMLLSSYINIIIALLTAPLQLLMGAVPGSNAFSSWFKNLVGNLLPFPITAAFFLISTMLAGYEQNPIGVPGMPTGPRLWSPPFIGGGTRGVTGIIALGILFAIPTIVNSLKESLKAKPPVAAGPGAVLGPIGSGVGSMMQFGYQAMFIKQALTERPRSDISVDKSVKKSAQTGAEGKLENAAER